MNVSLMNSALGEHHQFGFAKSAGCVQREKPVRCCRIPAVGHTLRAKKLVATVSWFGNLLEIQEHLLQQRCHGLLLSPPTIDLKPAEVKPDAPVTFPGGQWRLLDFLPGRADDGAARPRKRIKGGRSVNKDRRTVHHVPLFMSSCSRPFVHGVRQLLLGRASTSHHRRPSILTANQSVILTAGVRSDTIESSVDWTQSAAGGGGAPSVPPRTASGERKVLHGIRDGGPDHSDRD